MKDNKDQIIKDIKRKLVDTTDRLKQSIDKTTLVEIEFAKELEYLRNLHS